jgi:hypothetical protein
METISSFDELAAFFAESGLVQESVPEQATIKLPTRKDTLDGVLFIRWEPEQQVVHFVQSLNIALTQERLEPFALAIALLNHVLPFPGFGINVPQGYSYYRVSMPLRPEGTLTKKEIQGLFNLSVRMASEHRPALAAVAENNADPMSILSAGQPPA